MPIPTSLLSRAIAWRLALLTVAAGLALLQGLVALAPGGLALPALSGAKGAERRAEPVAPLRPAAAPPERRAAILERPLFHPDRRPLAEATPEAPALAPAGEPVVAAVPPELPAWSLLGTAIDGARSTALVRSPALPHPVTLRRGEALEGWSVQAIGRGRVLLERDGLRFELALPGMARPGAH